MLRPEQGRHSTIRDGRLQAPLLAKKGAGALRDVPGDGALLEGTTLRGGDTQGAQGEKRARIGEASVAKGQHNDVGPRLRARAIRVLAHDTPAGGTQVADEVTVLGALGRQQVGDPGVDADGHLRQDEENPRRGGGAAGGAEEAAAPGRAAAGGAQGHLRPA